MLEFELSCAICNRSFRAKASEADFFEELFGIRCVECPSCGSATPISEAEDCGQQLN